jgi:hypothetical protein
MEKKIQFGGTKQILLKINNTGRTKVLTFNDDLTDKYIINAIKNNFLKDGSIVVNIIFGKNYVNYNKNTSKLKNGYTLHITTVGIINFSNFTMLGYYNDFKKDSITNGIFNISWKKPVGSFDSGLTINRMGSIRFKVNWKLSTDTTAKQKFLDTLSSDISIKAKYPIVINFFVDETIFYSVEFFKILSDIFGYTIDQGLELLKNTPIRNKDKMDFIRCAFGNYFTYNNKFNGSNGTYSEHILQPNNQIKFNFYKDICTLLYMIFNTEKSNNIFKKIKIMNNRVIFNSSKENERIMTDILNKFNEDQKSYFSKLLSEKLQFNVKISNKNNGKFTISKNNINSIILPANCF